MTQMQERQTCWRTGEVSLTFCLSHAAIPPPCLAPPSICRKGLRVSPSMASPCLAGRVGDGVAMAYLKWREAPVEGILVLVTSPGLDYWDSTSIATRSLLSPSKSCCSPGTFVGPLSRAPELVEATYTCSSTRNVHKHGISQSLVKGGDPFGCSCSWRISRKYGRLLPRASCCLTFLSLGQTRCFSLSSNTLHCTACSRGWVPSPGRAFLLLSAASQGT